MGMFGKKKIYLDYAAATPVDKKVQRVQKKYQKYFYNPSALYREAVDVRTLIDTARLDIAKQIQSHADEVIFTSGATDANNRALMGVVRKWENDHPREQAHIIVSAIEHASVREVAAALEQEGVLVDILPVDREGRVLLEKLGSLLKPTTVLISVGYVNGEIGSIQDIRALMKKVRQYRKQHDSVYPYVHTDATQAIGIEELITVPQLGINLMSFSSAKIYGPKKIGVLFVRRGVLIDPITFGGIQEGALVPGTENVVDVVAFAEALSRSRNIYADEFIRLKKLKAFFIAELKSLFPTIIINSQLEGAPHIVNVTFPGISHEELVLRLDARGVMVSQKSACKSDTEGSSHVILAIREENPNPQTTGSIRFSFGRGTTRGQLIKTIKVLQSIVPKMHEVQKEFYE